MRVCRIYVLCVYIDYDAGKRVVWWAAWNPRQMSLWGNKVYLILHTIISMFSKANFKWYLTLQGIIVVVQHNIALPLTMLFVVINCWLLSSVQTVSNQQMTKDLIIVFFDFNHSAAWYKHIHIKTLRLNLTPLSISHHANQAGVELLCASINETICAWWLSVRRWWWWPTRGLTVEMND